MRYRASDAAPAWRCRYKFEGKSRVMALDDVVAHLASYFEDLIRRYQALPHQYEPETGYAHRLSHDNR